MLSLCVLALCCPSLASNAHYTSSEKVLFLFIALQSFSFWFTKYCSSYFKMLKVDGNWIVLGEDTVDENGYGYRVDQ